MSETAPVPLAKAILLLFVFLILGSSIELHVLLPAEADKAWLLHAAHVWLDGGKLYVDIMEVNPPLIIWLYALPVRISQLLPHLADFEALALLGLLCSVCFVALCMQLMRMHPGFQAQSRRNELILLLLLIFIFYNNELYFFDRDHIFLVFTFPYMLRFMPSLASAKPSRPLRVAIGLAAAVGYCMKPHTLVVWGTLQALYLWRMRSPAILRSLENAVIYAFGVMYVLAVWHFDPDYFRYVMPMASATYLYFSNIHSNYVFLPPLFISAGLVFIEFRTTHPTPYRRDIVYFVLLDAAFILYAQINNGWGYTYSPMLCMFIFLTGWMFWDFLWVRQALAILGEKDRKVDAGLRGCVIVLALHCAYMMVYLFSMTGMLSSMRHPCDNDPRCERMGPYVAYVRDNHIHSFGTLSFDYTHWVKMLRLPGVEWLTRYNHLWMMARMADNGGEAFTASHYWILEYVAQGLADDLDRRKPQIVFVDNSPAFLTYTFHFDVPGFLSRVPEFKAAWSHYRLKDTMGTCKYKYDVVPSECRYDIYWRKP